mmetsp:Transcript_6672/g.21592  ORF Transcript_6672/g.21592 Transcript_6672/m.21592 type:complete len:213 (+) Transcript_6672:1052-1690(+)
MLAAWWHDGDNAVGRPANAAKGNGGDGSDGSWVSLLRQRERRRPRGDNDAGAHERLGDRAHGAAAKCRRAVLLRHPPTVFKVLVCLPTDELDQPTIFCSLAKEKGSLGGVVVGGDVRCSDRRDGALLQREGDCVASVGERQAERPSKVDRRPKGALLVGQGSVRRTPRDAEGPVAGDGEHVGRGHERAVAHVLLGRQVHLENAGSQWRQACR